MNFSWKETSLYVYSKGLALPVISLEYLVISVDWVTSHLCNYWQTIILMFEHILFRSNYRNIHSWAFWWFSWHLTGSRRVFKRNDFCLFLKFSWSYIRYWKFQSKTYNSFIAKSRKIEKLSQMFICVNGICK